MNKNFIKYILLSLVVAFPQFLVAKKSPYWILVGGQARISGPTCINLNDEYTYTLDFPDSIRPHVVNGSWGVSEELQVLSKAANSITVKSTDHGYGTVYYTYENKLDLQESCVRDTCLSYYYRNSLVVNKIFTPPSSVVIDGNNVIRAGQKFVFSVSKLPFSFDWGRNNTVSWILPTSLAQSYASYFKESITVLAKNPRENDSLTLVVGKCNSATPLKIELLVGTIKPTITAPEKIRCLSAAIDSLILSIENPNPTYTYWWKVKNSNWNVKALNPSKDRVLIRTQGEPGFFEVYATNKRRVDTVFTSYEVSRQLTDDYTINLAEVCLSKNAPVEAYLYPSPNMKVQWILPEGWNQDFENEFSSAIYPQTTENAVSGFMIAQTMECKQILDSVYVYVQDVYDTTQGINTGRGNCMGEGDTAIYSIVEDPNVSSYVWTFPTDWSPQSITITDPKQTEVQVVVGSEKGAISVKGITCAGEWTMQVDSLAFKPQAPTLRAPFSDCIHLGLSDTITLGVQSEDEDSHSYIWTLPQNWQFLGRDTASSIQVITDGIGGFHTYEVKAVNACGESKEALVDSVEVKGIGVDCEISFTYLAPLKRYMVKINPSLTLVDYKISWYATEFTGTPVSTNSSFSTVSLADKYYAHITSHTTGCSSLFSKDVSSLFRAPMYASSNDDITLNEQAVLVYPNPTTSIVTISGLLEFGAQEIMLLDLSGTVLEAKLINHSDALELDLSPYAKGTYVIILWNAKGEKIIKKIQRSL